MHGAVPISDDDPVWAPWLPGAGSLRATMVLELYSRLVFSDLTTLLLDSLIRRYRGEGASAAELSEYLALPESIVAQTLEHAPTAIVVLSSSGIDQPVMDESKDAAAEGPTSSMDSKRFYVNYRTMLPYVYTHVKKMLLLHCRVATPPSSSETISSSSSLAALDENPCVSWFCAGCSSYRTTGEIRSNTTCCSTCGNDVVQSTIYASESWWSARLNSKESLVTESKGGEATTSDHQQQHQQQHPIPPLFRADRFALQQSLILLFLLQEPLCFLDEKKRIVVDPDEVFTRKEFAERVAHRSSLALRFRAKHRNGAHVRVSMVQTADKERLQEARNKLRLSKRHELPPWLLPDALPTFTSSSDMSSSDVAEGNDCNIKDSSGDGGRRLLSLKRGRQEGEVLETTGQTKKASQQTRVSAAPPPQPTPLPPWAQMKRFAQVVLAAKDEVLRPVSLEDFDVVYDAAKEGRVS